MHVFLGPHKIQKAGGVDINVHKQKVGSWKITFLRST